jgi:hypothetical protein
MLIKITRGVGGRKGLRILLMTCLLGALLIVVGLKFRHKMTAPKGVSVTALPTGEIVKLGEKARGTMRDLIYKADELVRVADPAVAKDVNGNWVELPDGAILLVKSVRSEHGDTWVTGVTQGFPPTSTMVVHSSFLTRYQPVLLNDKIEFSDMHLVHQPQKDGEQLIVCGYLRNITSQIISQCVVVSVLNDAEGRALHQRRSIPMTLTRQRALEFEVPHKVDGIPYKSISVQTSYADADGKRVQLSLVSVQRSSLE